MNTVIILGSDRRFDSVAERFAGECFRVRRHGTCREAAAYLFPLGEKTEGVKAALKDAAPESLVFVGRADEELRQFAKRRGFELVPLLEEEAYLASNALATAEGTLSKLIEATPRLLEETCVLILGYGNCGKALARLLWLVGCQVWVFSHEGSMRRAQEDGFNIYRLPGEQVGMFDAILNTVPAPLFTPEILNALPTGTLLFQIASGNSGLDPRDLEARGILFHPLPGLPGRVAPETEADAIYRVMNRHLFQSIKESE